LEDVYELEAASVPLWAWLVAMLAVLAIYAVSLDNGTLLRSAAHTAHELFHDARHFAGVPCH
jgi:hypothetical protein